MQSYEEALRLAQANVWSSALVDVLALVGTTHVQVSQMAVVFAVNAPGQELIGVWSHSGGLESLDELTSIGLLHQGVDLLLHPPAGDAPASTKEME